MPDLFVEKPGFVKRFPKLWLGLLMVSCHPDGCYGPRAYNYNTQGTTPAALVGTYRLGKDNGGTQQERIEDDGFIHLKPDMTFESVQILERNGSGGISTTALSTPVVGRWRIIKTNAIWEVELLRQTANGEFSPWKQFPIIGQKPPHEIELFIDHDRGEWIRYHRDAGK
jgi:hypothetical protein